MALPALLAAERQGAIDRDLPLLAALWSEDARVVDGRSTETADDDYVWEGRAAVLDRYVTAVFPNPPPPLSLPLSLQIEEDGAMILASHAGDRWEFVQRDGRWWIRALAYQCPCAAERSE